MKPTQKSQLRATVLSRRDAIPEPLRAGRSRDLSSRLMAMEEFSRAGTVMAYMSMGSEYDTRMVLEAVLKRGGKLVLPRVDRSAKVLALHEVKDLERDLKPGIWGIREPDPEVCPRVDLPSVDFILVPGAVFDSHRHRLGYGGGFYDKLLASPQRRALTVAVAFEEQMVSEVPMEPHDVTIDMLVTDHALHR